MMDPAAARLRIDLDALIANYLTLAKAARGAEVAPAIKADAYGLGVEPVARRLWAEGARSFFVARVGEGEQLRPILGPASAATIFVLDGCPPGAAARLARSDLTPILNSLAQVEDWTAHARAGGPVAAGLHVDTGMNRLGLRIEEIEALLTAPDRLHGLEVGLVMSHLACSDAPEHPLNGKQLERFRRVARMFPHARKSLANSGGVFLGEDYLFDMVRPGISLYGGGPRGRPDARIRPVASLLSPILQVRSVPAGESIGYGATYVADAPRRVAIVAAGYADGVLRAESPGGHGWLRGVPCPFLGRISMDLLALDVTDCAPAAPGDEVELFGPNVPLDDAARAAGTISYELLVRLGARLDRRYVDGLAAESGETQISPQ